MKIKKVAEKFRQGLAKEALFAIALFAAISVSGMGFDESFRNPPPGYGEVPFWWWYGDRLDKKRLLWQIEELHRAGVSGMQINYCHYITGPWNPVPSDPDVFTDEWWDIFSFVAVECAKRNMGIGLSDYALAFPGRENLYKRLKICTPETYSKVLEFRKDGSVVPVARPGTLDPMNAETSRRLITRFFDPFLEHTPPEARKALNYFFQDELVLTDFQRIWTDDFAEEFKKRKGYDVVPKLKGLFTDIGPDTNKVRIDFNDVQVALTEERYFRPLYDWHAKRGLIYGCDHASRGKNPFQFGDYMRCARWYTAPGFDTPGSGPDPVKCKVGSSIAHLYRRPRVWLEAYHSMGWQASTETIFASTARNYVYGANLFALHGLYYATYGGWWEWAPPCYHFHQPYWALMPHTLKYFERLSWALTRGVHVCDVAVVMPQEMMVVNSNKGRKSTALSHAIIEKLAVEGTCDCDVIDSDSLAAATIGSADGEATLDVAGERYRAIVIPLMDVMRPASCEKLAAFRAAGGKVVDARTVDDVKLPLVRTPDVVGNPGLKVNHRRTETEDIYYLVDWDGKTDIRFRDRGELSLYDLWTGERTERPVSGQPVLAVVRKGGQPVVLKGLAETRTVVATLPDAWEVEFKPTLDNRWGDFRLPASDDFIGPEVREMTWVERSEKARLEFGPQFIQDGTNVFSFGWRWNVADKPQLQNRHHGLDSRVGDEFFVLGSYSQAFGSFYDIDPKQIKVGKGSPATFSTFVYAPCDLEAEVVCTAEGVREAIGECRWPKPRPTSIKVAGRIVSPGAKVRLAKGYTPVEASYDGFGRAALVFRRTDIAAKESRMPLSMRWYQDPSVLPYDPFGGKVTRGTFTATVPPGAYDAEVDVNGKLLKKEIRDGVLTLEIAFAPGLVGGNAFNGPVKLKTRPAKMKLGDWGAIDGLHCYSGGAIYRTRFDFAADSAKGRILLSLGSVGCAASVSVNGKRGHVVTCPPWEVDVTDDLKQGENAVEVTVYNTLNNHYQTIPSRYKVPVEKCPSGLIGPVTVMTLSWGANPALQSVIDGICPEKMQEIYDEVKTPFKYGMIMEAPQGLKYDNPTVYRHNGLWCMLYIQFDGKGYETRFATSKDLLHWEDHGLVLKRGNPGEWDVEQSDGFPMLLDTEWGGSNALKKFDGKYWMMYIGGAAQGYETDPLLTGVAYTDDPSVAKPWTKWQKNPVLTPFDKDARYFEKVTLYKHFAVEDPSRALGGRFVDYYNGKNVRGEEQVGIAVSDDMVTWRRYGADATIVDTRVGDPMIQRIGDIWVMFYYCAGRTCKGAFDTFACSRDLVHWTLWQGEPLVKPSEAWDSVHAHKPWVIKHDGVVYHFYNAVGNRGRGLALATSVDMKTLKDELLKGRYSKSRAFPSEIALSRLLMDRMHDPSAAPAHKVLPFVLEENSSTR